MKFSLDNDVLSDILNSPWETDRIVLLLRKCVHSLVLSADVHKENITGSSREHVVSRGVELSKLLNTGKVEFLRELKYLVTLELDSTRKNYERPFLSKKETRRIATWLEDRDWSERKFDEIERQRIEFHHLKKDFANKEREMVMQLKKSADWDSSMVESDLRQFKGLGTEPKAYSIGFGVLRAGFNRLTYDRYKKRVETKHAKASHILATLFVFRAMAVCLGEGRSEFSDLKEIQDGDVYDLMNAASAGYADVFVTSDKKLTALCETLRNRGIFQFETIDRTTFLRRLEEA
jgi:hypothetical protein